MPVGFVGLFYYMMLKVAGVDSIWYIIEHVGHVLGCKIIQALENHDCLSKVNAILDIRPSHLREQNMTSVLRCPNGFTLYIQNGLGDSLQCKL